MDKIKDKKVKCNFFFYDAFNGNMCLLKKSFGFDCDGIKNCIIWKLYKSLNNKDSNVVK